MYGTTIIAFGV